MNASDDVIATLSARVTELSKRVAMLQAELESATKRIAIYEEHDGAIQEALSSALRAAYQIRERAEVAAGQILEQAREERRMLLKEIERLRDERDDLENEIATHRRSGITAVAPTTPLSSEAAAQELRAVANEALKGIFREIAEDVRNAQRRRAARPEKVVEVEETPTAETSQQGLVEEEEVMGRSATASAQAEREAAEAREAEARAAEARATEARLAEERAAAQRAAEERAAAEARAAEEHAAAQRAAEERAAAESRAAEERAAALRATEERAASEARAAEERAAAQRAAEERAASEARAAEERAAAQRAAEERAVAEARAAQDRAAHERAIAEQRVAEQRAADERAAQERAAQDRAAQERAVAERAAAERAAAERAQAEARAAQERAAAERAAAERAAAERAAAEARAAAERAAAERAAAERAAAERAAAERAAAERAIAARAAAEQAATLPQPPAPPPLEVVRPPIEAVHIAPARVEAAMPTSDIQLVLSPIGSFPRLVEIERHIQALAVVRTLYVRDFRGGRATLAVALRSPMTPEDFASLLAGLQQPRMRLMSGSRNTLELRIEGEASIA